MPILLISAILLHLLIYRKKKIYQIDKPTLKINKNDPDIENAYYINKDFVELLVNFVGIESTYNYCNASLQSCLCLHKYIRAIYRSQRMVNSASTSLTPLFLRPIPTSITNLLVPISGLAFRRWNYVITFITFDLALLLVSNNPNNLVCLNTGCEIILVNKM